MNENENMVNEAVVEEEEFENNEGGIGTGLAILIGSGLTVAAIVAGKKLKGLYDNYKAKKASKENDSDDEIVDVIKLEDESK